MNARASYLLCVLALAAAPACSGDDSDTNATTHDSHTTSTGTDTHDSHTSGTDTHGTDTHADTDTDTDTGGVDVDEYMDGITKASDAGAFTVSLTSDPSPPIKGVNTWTLMITDGGGAGVEGGTITVTPWMPAHGHGSNSEAVVTADGGGQYTVTPVDLHMAGVWDTTIAIDDGMAMDEVHFVFDIPEA